MPIIGLTHDAEGKVIVRRTITTKVAIGLGPDEEAGRNYPARLDHFLFLKKVQEGEGNKALMVWDVDQEKQDYYIKQCGGNPPREVWIILLDDNPDEILRCEYAVWTKTGKWCWGDGDHAMRRTKADEEAHPYGPCWNDGCPQPDHATLPCRISADLYFMLADFPSLGTICRLHTSSRQSTQELRTALADLRGVTGGRLLGLRVKLFVRPERAVYQSPDGQRKTGIKWVVGMSLAAEDLPKLAAGMVETAKLFDSIRAQLGNRRLELVEGEIERAPEIAAEFHPAVPEVPVLVQIATPDSPERQEVEKLMDGLAWTRAAKDHTLGQYQGKLAELIERLKVLAQQKPTSAPQAPTASADTKGTPAEASAPKRRRKAASPGSAAASPLAAPAPAAPQQKKWSF